MSDFFSSLNTDFFQGLAIFIAFLTALIQFYSHKTTEESREKHKIFLLRNLQIFSNISFQNTGITAAKIFTKLMEIVFKKPRSYNLTDPVFWNDRSVLFFLMIALVVNSISIYKWTTGFSQFFYHILPFLMLLSSFLHFMALRYSYTANHSKKVKLKSKDGLPRHIRRQKEKERNKRNSSKLFYKIQKMNPYRYDILTIFITIGLRIAPLWIFFFIWLVFFQRKNLELVAAIFLLAYYGWYIVTSVLSFNITRILMSKLINSNKIQHTLKLVITDLFWAFLISIVSYFIADGIAFYLHIQVTSEEYLKSKGVLSAEYYRSFAYHFWFLFLSSFLPSILFLFFAFIEIFFRIFIHPTQKIIVFLFDKVIKYNYHQYIFAIIIVFICIQLLKRLV